MFSQNLLKCCHLHWVLIVLLGIQYILIVNGWVVLAAVKVAIATRISKHFRVTIY